MTDFVLVHGGWQGAWCWELLIGELAARGSRAVAVDLPAEDPDAGAADYAAAVRTALPGRTPPPEPATSLLPPAKQRHATPEAEPSLPRGAEHGRSRREEGPPREGVVLVGHSLAGLTIPLVAATHPVRHLVYLAAMLPEPGRSVAEGDRQTVRGLGRGQLRHDDGSTSWEPEAAVARLFPDSPPDRARWAAARLRRQHWRILQETTPLTRWPDVPSTYLRCEDDAVIDAGWARRAVPERLGVEPVTLPGDHSPFLARPAELADLLAAL
ncbi:MAG: alpha/beta fold hydrolase [Mycobacteriales bacterium]